MNSLNSVAYNINEKIFDHCVNTMNNISDVKKRLRHDTLKLAGERTKMLSAPDQCEWIKQMCLLTNAKRGIVIGVFTGYSALCFAEGLTNDGKLVCLDVDAESVNMGLPFWKQAGVANKMDVRIGPALETLEKMKQQYGPGSFDFAYVDADKKNQANYIDSLLYFVRQNGFIILDNMFLSAKVIDDQAKKESEDVIAELGSLPNDPRVDCATIMLAHGVTLLRKR